MNDLTQPQQQAAAQNPPLVVPETPERLDAFIAERRQNIARLAAQREVDEHEYADLKAKYDKLAARLGSLRESLMRTSQERTSLIKELDTLLQAKGTRDNVRKREEHERTIRGAPPPAAPRVPIVQVGPQAGGNQAPNSTGHVTAMSPPPRAAAPTPAQVAAPLEAEVVRPTLPPEATTYRVQAPAEPQPAAAAAQIAAPPEPQTAAAGKPAPTQPPAMPNSRAEQAPAAKPSDSDTSGPVANAAAAQAAAAHAAEQATAAWAAAAQSRAAAATPGNEPQQAATPAAEAVLERPPAFGNRRTQPRVPLAVEIDLRGDTNLYVGFSENISEGGLFVATYEPRPVGERIAVSFTLPGQIGRIDLETEVAWSVEYRDEVQGEAPRVPGMGLRFLNLGEKDRRTLTHFIGQREPLFFPQ